MASDRKAKRSKSGQPLPPAAAWPFRADTPPAEYLEALELSDYVQALESLATSISGPQKSMLIGHAQSEGGEQTMDAIAAHAGYEGFQGGNAQYGRLGRLFADHFGITGLANQTLALATESEAPDEQGRFMWVMRPPLVMALAAVGWIDPLPVDSLMANAAAALVDADPACANLAPTTRLALINARIGQGLYRAQMMRLWQGQCAVTGCTLSAVLVASHAKSWSSSTNAERLDPFNGLLLSANLDRLFDRGLIAFGDDGGMLKGTKLTDTDLHHLSIPPHAALRNVDDRHRPYLTAHRLAFAFAH